MARLYIGIDAGGSGTRAAQSQQSVRQLPAATAARLAALVLLVLSYVGSRGLRDFDAALVGYAVGTVFALAAVVYRYTLWITRPPTWRYWKAGWTNFLSWRNFLRYTAMIPVAWWTDIFAQTFILKRSLQRWIMHMGGGRGWLQDYRPTCKQLRQDGDVLNAVGHTP